MLWRLAQGESHDEAARSMGVARATVRNHLRAALAATGCRRSPDLVALGWRSGWFGSVTVEREVVVEVEREREAPFLQAYLEAFDLWTRDQENPGLQRELALALAGARLVAARRRGEPGGVVAGGVAGASPDLVA